MQNPAKSLALEFGLACNDDISAIKREETHTKKGKHSMTADHTSIDDPDGHAHSAQLAYWFYLAFVLMALAASAVLIEAQAAW